MNRMVLVKFLDPVTGEEVCVGKRGLLDPQVALLWQQDAEYKYGIVAWLEYDPRAVW